MQTTEDKPIGTQTDHWIILHHYGNQACHDITSSYKSAQFALYFGTSASKMVWSNITLWVWHFCRHDVVDITEWYAVFQADDYVGVHKTSDLKFGNSYRVVGFGEFRPQRFHQSR